MSVFLLKKLARTYTLIHAYNTTKISGTGGLDFNNFLSFEKVTFFFVPAVVEIPKRTLSKTVLISYFPELTWLLIAVFAFWINLIPDSVLSDYKIPD